MIYDPVAGKGVGKLLDALSTGGVIMIYGVLDMSRLSCHRFRANEVRLLLGVIAYNLGNLL